MKADTTDVTASGDTDISVGGLTVSDRFMWRADCTLPYLENAVQWYVPCAKRVQTHVQPLQGCTL
jgi:hypothetical protein